MIIRRDIENRLRTAIGRAPIVLVTGARQVGKSTLVDEVVRPDPKNRFDLENPQDLGRLSSPMLALGNLTGTVVIDEAQRKQDLFPSLRVLADQRGIDRRFVILGSASPDLVGLAAESLAGRVEMIELSGLSVRDVGSKCIDDLWLRGAYPRSFLSPDESASRAWRNDYVRTFLERDLANLGFRIPATTMRRFWTMVAHYHGQTWNGSELARALGVSQPTIRGYLDALTDALVVRQLQPWHENLKKRQVRSPKVYIRDSGLLHRLLDIDDVVALNGHPKSGASWEGFVIEQLLGNWSSGNLHEHGYYWATHNGAEIDLLFDVGIQKVGIEVKRTDTPTVSPSMRTAIQDLGLAKVLVVHAGNHRYRLAEEIEAVPADQILTWASLQEGIESG